jgi:hypothetical protein
MRQLAAMMMFAAWLLYGAMPAMAMPDMRGITAVPMAEAGHGHAPHQDMTAGSDATPTDHASHAHGETEKPCPHGSGKGCVTPFCAACLVLLPQITFADTGRFIHPVPGPEDASPLILSAARPPVPPPRA